MIREGQEARGKKQEGRGKRQDWTERMIREGTEKKRAAVKMIAALFLGQILAFLHVCSRPDVPLGEHGGIAPTTRLC